MNKKCRANRIIRRQRSLIVWFDAALGNFSSELLVDIDENYTLGVGIT